MGQTDHVHIATVGRIICKLDILQCPELTPDVPRVEETQVTHKGFIHPC